MILKKLLLTLLLFVFALPLSVNAQQSDYEIQKQFKLEADSLLSAIETMQSAQQADSILVLIDSLRSTYKEHEQLLDNALYPKTFGQTVKELNTRTQSLQHKLLVIENQSEQLADITDQLAVIGNRFEEISATTDSLRKAIALSEKSEAKLSGLLKDYRKQVEQRDAFILDMIDSVLVSYENLASGDISEYTVKESKFLTNKDNVFEIIEQVSKQNIDFLQQNPDMAPEDYLRMYTVHRKFEQMWETTGDKLVQMYDYDVSESKKIDKNISEWGTLIEQETWISIYDHLKSQQIQINNFEDKNSFFEAVNGYINKMTADSTSFSPDKLIAFKTFWNDSVKGNWGNYVVESNLLSLAQISQVDSKMDTWEELKETETGLNKILFGAAFVIIAGLIIALFYKSS